jgi:hypothetical protein
MSRYNNNEDKFFVKRLTHYYPEVKIATVEIALRFAFECVRRYCCELNNYTLSFACYAWHKIRQRVLGPLFPYVSGVSSSRVHVPRVLGERQHLVEPDEIGVTSMERTGDRIDQNALSPLAELTAGLARVAVQGPDECGTAPSPKISRGNDPMSPSVPKTALITGITGQDGS